MADDARRRILERRAKFVAAAMGAVAAAAHCAKPEACLSAVADEKKVTKPAPEDASVAEIGGSDQPMPCLSEAPNPPEDAPKPRPCLKIAAPHKDAGPKICLDFE